jgi:endonuclease/exonuclease/phosphatase family metal-dependent hydrolase
LGKRIAGILRSFLVATINIGNDQQLQVVSTQLHQLNQDSAIRELQTKTILDFWNKAGHTIIMGDFNADPSAPELEVLRQAGLVDGAVAFGGTPSYTTIDDRRLDYLWLSPDLKVSDFKVTPVKASDHAALIVLVKE